MKKGSYKGLSFIYCLANSAATEPRVRYDDGTTGGVGEEESSHESEQKNCRLR